MQFEMTSKKAVKEAKRLQKVLESKGLSFSTICEGLAQARGFANWSAYIAACEETSPAPISHRVPATITPPAPADSVDMRPYNLTMYVAVKVRVNDFWASSAAEAAQKAMDNDALMRDIADFVDRSRFGRYEWAELAEDEDPITVLVDDLADEDYDNSQWHQRQKDGTMTLDPLHEPQVGDLVYVGPPRRRDLHSQPFYGRLVALSKEAAIVSDAAGVNFHVDSDNVRQLEYAVEASWHGSKVVPMASKKESVNEASVTRMSASEWLDCPEEMLRHDIKLYHTRGTVDYELVVERNEDDDGSAPYLFVVRIFEDGLQSETKIYRAEALKNEFRLEDWSLEYGK